MRWRELSRLTEVVSGVRFEILEALASRGPLRFAELLAELGMGKGRSSLLSYHLKILEDEGLIVKVPHENYMVYVLSSKGRRIYEALKELLEKIEMDVTAPSVMTSSFSLERFDRRKIEQALVREAGLPRELAKEVAIKAEERLRELQVKWLTSDLIRELVNVILLEMGLHGARAKLSRLGLPVYDVGQTISAGVENIDEVFSSSIQGRYAIISILGEDRLAIHHIRGEINIDDLRLWPSRIGELTHRVDALLLRCGLEGVGGLSPCIEVRDLESAFERILLHLRRFSGDVIYGQGLEALNIVLAPLVRGLSYSELVRTVRRFLLSTYFLPRSQASFISIGLYDSLPDSFMGSSIKLGGETYTLDDYEEEVKLLFHAFIDATSIVDELKRPLENIVFHLHVENLDERLIDILRSPFPSILIVGDNNTYSPSLCKGLRGSFEAWAVGSFISLNMPRLALGVSDEKRLIERLENLVETSIKIFRERHAQLSSYIKAGRPLSSLSWFYKGGPYLASENVTYTLVPIGLYELIHVFLGKDYIRDEDALEFAEKILGTLANLARKAEERLSVSVSAPGRLEAAKRFYELDRKMQTAVWRRIAHILDWGYYSVELVPSTLHVNVKRKIEVEGRLARFLNGGYVFRLLASRRLLDSEEEFREVLDIAVSNGLNIVEIAKNYTYCIACQSVTLGFPGRCPRCGGRGTYLKRYGSVKGVYRVLDKDTLRLFTQSFYY